MTTPNTFIQLLANAAPPAHCANPYRSNPTTPHDSCAPRRRRNLQRYLHAMQPRHPRWLLVGEAPGYRGCRLTGIPFVSPHLLTAGIDSVDLFGAMRGYEPCDLWPQVRGEASATIMWETLAALPRLPVLWNAFPFHPHRPGHPDSNRTPKTAELMAGRPFLTHLLTLFPTVEHIAAVGRRADAALHRWEIPHHTVRHPSHGGKHAFQHGLHTLIPTP